jgi:hypothetical protein
MGKFIRDGRRPGSGFNRGVLVVEVTDVAENQQCTMLFAVNVATIVKYHSNQLKADQFSVITVLANNKMAAEQTEATDVKDLPVLAVVLAAIEAKNKCLTLYVTNVVMNAKCHSNQLLANQYFVMIALRK